jgi:hypothetical protein
MTKRQRVEATLRGEPVDRIPLAYWMHNFHAAGDAARAHRSA